MFCVKLVIQKTATTLVTKRSLNNTLIVIFSAMLGSIAGLLSLSGRAMNFAENAANKVSDKIKAKNKIKKIKRSRKDLIEKNIDKQKDKKIPSEGPSIRLDSKNEITLFS